MKKIHENLDFTEVGYFESILKEAGIKTLVKNVGSSGLAGEVPFGHVCPELWIVDDDAYEKALQILKPYYQAMRQPAPDWKCTCGESLEGSFGECWKCGAPAPMPAPPHT